MGKVLLYCRVSVTSQENGLDAQEQALRKYCEQRGITDFEIYSDHGVSGAKTSRPALDKLMTKVSSGEVSTVVAYSLSRLSRSTSHLLQTLEQFQNHKVEFISLTEQISLNSPAGKMMVTVLGAVAELERNIIIERTKCGLEAARRRGTILGRKKSRPSQLIRDLLGQGMSYRKISAIAKCSTWCVAQEAACLEREHSQTA